MTVPCHQIALCDSRKYDNRWSWGKLNIEQGALLHPDCLIFDPLLDGASDACVHLHIADAFEPDKRAQRAIVSPFVINDANAIKVLSVMEEFSLTAEFKPGFYQVYFEVCQDKSKGGKKDDNVFYRFTLVRQSRESRIIYPHYLRDDPWGGEKGKELVIGKADKPFRMTLSRMRKYLRSPGIPETCQILVNIAEQERSAIKRSIGWHPPGGCHCIAHDFETGEGWSVFYAERGQRFLLQTFTDETDACHELIYRAFGK